MALHDEVYYYLSRKNKAIAEAFRQQYNPTDAHPRSRTHLTRLNCFWHMHLGTVTNTDTVVVVEGDTVYTTIYDTIIITETIEVPGDDITATIVIDIEGTCNDISTGMTEGDFTANELTAYPNPVLDVLNIQINNTSSISGSFTLNIYAIDGSLVKTETISSTATVDLSSLEAGFHVIEVIE